MNHFKMANTLEQLVKTVKIILNIIYRLRSKERISNFFRVRCIDESRIDLA